ncbi:MAG: undecaprenyl diphosphate synthase family protein [Anaerolineales bacterium]|nr:undecaprenyl diphosphate synthase family protein [Anaerolineales bacterium]
MLIPKHIAFIMDGNGRWATERGLPRSAGHKAGYERIPMLHVVPHYRPAITRNDIESGIKRYNAAHQ